MVVRSWRSSSGSMAGASLRLGSTADTAVAHDRARMRLTTDATAADSAQENAQRINEPSGSISEPNSSGVKDALLPQARNNSRELPGVNNKSSHLTTAGRSAGMVGILA